MKLGAKIAIIVVSCILCAVIIAMSVGISISNKANDDTVPNGKLADWQSFIQDDTPVRKMAITGSHDAGTAGMAWLAETQSRSIAEQLLLGTRYFDLRVKEKKGKFVIYHGPFTSVTLDEVLDAFNAFLSAHPTEMLMLDFQQCVDGAYQVIFDKLGDRIYQNDTADSNYVRLQSLTLNEVRGKCILFSKKLFFDENANRVFLRAGDDGLGEEKCLRSFYEQKWNYYYSSKKYISKALPDYINRFKEFDAGIFVLQGQLTDGLFVLGPKYREGGHVKNMNAYVKSLATSEDLAYINVVMRDFLSPEKSMGIISLNYAKGYVKSEAEADFFECTGMSH